MNLEEAENFISHDNCENCPCLVNNTDEFECDADEYCHDVFREASKTVISEREARISELEKQNAKLVAENERMRCCGNCDHNEDYTVCAIGKHTSCVENNLLNWKPKE